MIKVGIIGFGKMGRIRATALEKGNAAQIIKVSDPMVMIKNCTYNFASSPDAIIQDPAIDAVFLCLPNSLHKSLTISALRAGKHVFCEKPPTINGAEMREVIEEEKRSGKKLMYGFNHRQHCAVIKMKEIIQRGSYGRVLWMRGRYGKSVDSNYFKTWRAKKELAGGGILLDQGIHMVDLLIHLGGDFDEVNAVVSNLYWNATDVEDNVFAIFRNSQTNVVASLHSTMTQWRHLFSLEVFLEAGYLVLNGLKTSSNTYGEEILTIARNRSRAPAATWEDEQQIHYHEDVSWEREVNSFTEAICNNKPIEHGSSSDALKVMDTIDMIYGNKRQEYSDLRKRLELVSG